MAKVGRPKGKCQVVPVRLKEKDLTIFKKFAEERNLPVSTCIRLLAYKSLKSINSKIKIKSDIDSVEGFIV